MRALAAELGHLPLVLHLAGSYLRTYRHSPLGQPVAYLAQLRQAGLTHRSFVRQGLTVTTHALATQQGLICCARQLRHTYFAYKC